MSINISKDDKIIPKITKWDKQSISWHSSSLFDHEIAATSTFNIQYIKQILTQTNINTAQVAVL